MTTIAELGIRIASDDAGQAADNLDRLVQSGSRAEKAADEVAASFDKAADSAKQLASAESGAGESAAEAKKRLLEMARTSLEASDYHKSLAASVTNAGGAMSSAKSAATDWAAYQVEINARGRALIDTESRLADSTRQAAATTGLHADSLRDLLGRIDPVSEKLRKLDEQQDRLVQFRNVGLIDEATFNRYSARLGETHTELERFQGGLNRTGVSAKQTAAAMRTLPAQFSDIFVSLQGGQAPLTVFLQQGSQIKDSFGGIGAAAKATGGYIAGLISPLTLSAAAVTGLAVAVGAGLSDLNEFNKALTSTSGVAGRSSSQLVDLQNKLANGKYFSQANEALLALAGSGKLTGETFDAVAGAATQLSAATGESAGNFAKMFVDAKNDVTAFALEFNSKYHAVTLATFDQIQALEDQGRHMDALKLLAGEVSEEMTQRNQEMAESTRGIAKLWNDATSALRGYWAELKRGVSADPDQFRMQVLQQQVADIDKQFWFSDSSRDALKKQYTDEIALIQKRIDAGAKERQDRADGEAAVQKQADLQKKLNDQLDQATPERKRDKALQDLRQWFIDLREAAKETGKQSPLLAGVSFDGDKVSGGAYDTLAKGIADRNKDRVGRTTSVDLSGFNDQKNALSAILAEYKNHQKELDAAQKAGLISQESYAAQRAAIIEQQEGEVTNAYQAEIAALEAAKGKAGTSAAQRVQLDQKIADARANMVKAQKDADSELAVLATNEEGRLKRQAAAVQAYTDQLERERQVRATAGDRAAAALGMGDRQAGLQRELDGVSDEFNRKRETLLDRRRTAPDKYSAEDYKRDLAILEEAESRYRETVVGNYDKISAAQGDWRNGASSAFSTYLEQARDVAGQTRTLFGNAFTSMEDAVANFAISGKFSFSDFTKSVLADMARIATRQAASGLLSSIAGSALGSWFSGAGGAAASAGSTQAGYGPQFMDNFVSGQRAAGGPVAANSLYQVNELGPELLNQGGKTYLMMGAEGGSITPLGAGPASTAAAAGGSGGGTEQKMEVTININREGGGDVSADTAMGQRLAPQFLELIRAEIAANERKTLSPSGGATWRAIQGRR